ncbi:MAG: ATP-binding protein [Pirellulales bacterium]
MKFPIQSSSFLAALHPDDQEAISAELERHWAGKTPTKSQEVRLRTKSGEYRWYLDRGKVVRRGQDGRPERMVGTITDITERRLVELELQAANQMLVLAQTVSRTGHWRFEVETAKSHWSRSTFRFFGRDEQVDPPPFEEFLKDFVPSSAEALNVHVQRALEHGESFTLILQPLADLSDVRYLRTEGRAKRDSSGKVIELYGTVTDVSEEIEREAKLKRAREEAESANRIKTQFLANISHEIRTPLTAILGFTDLLRDPVLFEDVQERMRILDTITGAGRHLLNVINDILDISKIEAEKVRIEVQPMNLLSVIREVEQLVTPMAQSKGLVIAISYLTQVPSLIQGDATRCRQILMNLVSNALNFTEQGQIRLVVSRETEGPEPQICIDVSDSGIGIPEDRVAELFQPFVQVDSSMTRRHSGNGLGLAISRKLARLMGGDVELLWTKTDVGSCFRFQIPMRLVDPADGVDPLSVIVSRTAVGTNVPTSENQPLYAKGRILLVEDGIDNQKLIALMLRKAGGDVDIADNGIDALKLVVAAGKSTAPYRLLITDMQMPMMDGLMLARALRERAFTAPIIVLSAHTMAEDKARAEEAGCSDYLTKPIDRKCLIDACSRHLDA